MNTNGVRYQHAIARRGKRWVEECDPVKYILSKNVHRRHLTAEQRRDAIATFIKVDPRASNREVARALKVDDKTVASVRAEPVSNAEIPQMEHLPIQRAKVAVRANPTASVGAVMKLAKVGRATVVRGRKLVAAEPSETVVSEATARLRSRQQRLTLSRRRKRRLSNSVRQFERCLLHGQNSGSKRSALTP